MSDFVAMTTVAEMTAEKRALVQMKSKVRCRSKVRLVSIFGKRRRST